MLLTELEETHAADASAAANEDRFFLVAAALDSFVAWAHAKHGSTPDVREYYGCNRPAPFNGFASGVEASEIIDVLGHEGLDAWANLDAIAEHLGRNAADAVEVW